MSQNGMSLIEILVSLAISGVLIFVSVDYVTSNQKERNFEEHMRGRAELQNVFNWAWDSPSFCSGNVKGKKVEKNEGAKIDVQIHEILAGGNQGPVLLGPGVKYDNHTRIESVELRHNSIVGADQQRLDLVLKGENTRSMVGTNKFIYTRSLLVVTDTDGVITECKTEAPNENELSRDICSIVTQGQTRYDPLVDKCVSNYSNCVTGTSAFAACPAGTEVVQCGAWGRRAYISGWAMAKRMYEDGREREGSAEDFFTRRDKATNSCSCTYAVEVNPSSMSCVACCGSPEDAGAAALGI